MIEVDDPYAQANELAEVALTALEGRADEFNARDAVNGLMLALTFLAAEAGISRTALLGAVAANFDRACASIQRAPEGGNHGES